MIMGADTAAKQDSQFAAMMNDEGAMIAVAYGNDEAALRRLRYFQRNDDDVYTPGVVNEGKLSRALAAGRNVQATSQMQTAAIDAVARSGKVFETRQELSDTIAHASRGNAAMDGALTGNTRYTLRQVGREDLGRGSDYEALREMDVATVGKQKAMSLEHLFGYGRSSGQPGRTAIFDAVDHALTQTNPEEAQHMLDVLYEAQFSQGLSPEQEQWIREAGRRAQTRYGNVSGVNMWQIAANRHFSRLSDRRLKKDIQYLYVLPNGIRLYRFRYIWGGPAYVGVMAQELLESYPEAVSTNQFGYYQVNYHLLGLEMRTYEEWLASGGSLSTLTHTETLA
jgi:hypothetical protein